MIATTASTKAVRRRAPASTDARKPRGTRKGGSFRSDADLARRALAGCTRIGASKAEAPDMIRSHGWYEACRYALTLFSRHLRAQGGSILPRATAQHAQAYLAWRATQVRQGQLDIDRRAIKRALGLDTERVRSQIPTEPGSRAYTRAQVELVIGQQSARDALSTELAWRCGLRGHELATLRLATERSASARRAWRDDRFAGRVGVRYTVVGKGGLSREVLVPHDLHARLGPLRRAVPREISNRRLRYQSHYDLAHGKAWARSFSETARRTLGWSTGAHGLRHSYAQARMAALLHSQGKEYGEALKIVSQELGHFRASITRTYLR